jgi:hypothetical protein
MTTEEARIVILEDALIQSHCIIDFLHKCLTSKDTHIYQYPEHILKHIEYLKSIIEMPKHCHHSYYAPDRGKECKPCEESRNHKLRLEEARNVWENQKSKTEE